MVVYLLGAEVETDGGPHASVDHSSLVIQHLLAPFRWIHDRFNGAFDRLHGAYQGLLDAALHHRLLTLVVLLGFAIGSPAFVSNDWPGFLSQRRCWAN